MPARSIVGLHSSASEQCAADGPERAIEALYPRPIDDLADVIAHRLGVAVGL